jgi:cytochrome P450
MSLTARANLDDPEFYQADLNYIYEIFAEMRREQPVFWYEPSKFWVLSKYEDQRYVESNPQLFSSRYGFLIGDNFDPAKIKNQLPDWAQNQLASRSLTRAETRGLICRATTSMGDPELINMGILDPPDHGPVRRVLTAAFNRHATARLRPSLARIIDDALDAIESGDTVEFTEAISRRIPLAVIAELVDVPSHDRKDFAAWAVAFLEAATLTPESDPDRIARVTTWAGQFTSYLGELIAKRRDDPGDDVVSHIGQSKVHDNVVDHRTALMLTALLVAGVSETSGRLLTAIGHALAERGDQREILVERPEYIDNAVEEVLRWYPIIWTQCRTALATTELRGETIHKDDYLVLPYPSANRDEEIWERPNDLDVTRPFRPPQHLAFGWGAHRCPGAEMARLQARVFLEKLLPRYPYWELAGEPVRSRTSIFVHGLDSMPVRFEATTPR